MATPTLPSNMRSPSSEADKPSAEAGRTASGATDSDAQHKTTRSSPTAMTVAPETRTITQATRRKITFAKQKSAKEEQPPPPPPPPDDLKELLSTPKRMAPALSLIALTWLLYGRLPAVAGAAWAVFFVTLAMAFETDEENPSWTTSTTTHAWGIGNAAGVVLGGAALQRHDYPVLLGLSLILGILVLVSPLVENSTSSLALLTAGFSVGITFLAGLLPLSHALWLHLLLRSFLAGPHEALSMIAILVPAWVCGVVGGVAAAVTPGSRLYTTAATIAALAVLAGAWGASHDPPIDPDFHE